MARAGSTRRRGRPRGSSTTPRPPSPTPTAAGRRRSSAPSCRRARREHRLAAYPDGLVRLDTRTGAHERFRVAPNERGLNPLNTLLVVTSDPYDPSILWAAGPTTGLMRFDTRTETFTAYRHDPKDPHSLSGDYAVSLLADRSGTMWVGTQESGLNAFNPKSVDFVHLRHDPDDAQSLAPGAVTGLYEDRAGTLWAVIRAVQVSYLTRFDAGGRVTRYRHLPGDPNSLQAGALFAIAEDTSGNLWVASVDSEGGLSRIDAASGRVSRFHRERTPENENRNATLTLLPTRADPDVLWVGSIGGLDRFDTRTGTFTSVPMRLGGTTELEREPPVLALHEDASGTLWAAALTFGLVRIRDGQAEIASAYDARDTTSISSNIFLDILERAGEPGILWLATGGGGLDRYDTRTGRTTHHRSEDGLPENHVYGILEDEAGTLWMSTNGGIVSFDPEAETFRTYGLEDGLMALEYNQGAFAKGAGGVLYFGSLEGITAFVPERLHINAVPPQVVLTGLRLSNEPVAVGPGSPLTQRLSETEQVTLAYDQNEVAFDYVGLHFANPAKNRYAYRLDGFDRDWIDAGAQRTATYTNLPPGRYTFRVKAANSDGVWNEEGASVGLFITPPWWRTWWAYALYGVLFCAGVFAVDRVQRRRLLGVERRRAAMREAELRAELAEEHTHHLEVLDEAKSRFFANISHEFRTPLTLLLGPLQDALGEDAPPERLMRQVPLMHRNAGRLLRLVGQVLDLAKLEAGSMPLHLRPVELVAFVRDLVLAFAPQAEREGLTVLFDTEEEALRVSVDPDKLEKIVTNLLSNAIKFTMRGGKVRVGLRAIDDRAGFVLTVSDTGRGIPDDEREHVFDRFYQVDSTTTREHEGTGLGLALVKELVELHRGTIAVESERGFGTTFTVRLPVAPRGAEPAGVAPPDDSEASDGFSSAVALEVASLAAAAPLVADPSEGMPAGEAEGTVLVVDDNADVRAFVRSHLAAHYRVLEAADGEGGLAMIRQHRPDLVVSDVMMPKLDGYALCRAVRADDALRHIPVILLTAKAEEADRIYGLEGGADDYLTKPFSTRELEVRVANLLLSRAHLRSTYSGMLRVPQTEVVIPPGEAAFMTQVLEVLNGHLGDSTFSTDRLADEVSLSRRQVERRVKTLTRQTPAELMRQIRLERAAQILEARPGSIAEVAYAVGFKSPSHFSVAFGKAYGHTPSEHLGDAP